MWAWWRCPTRADSHVAAIANAGRATAGEFRKFGPRFAWGKLVPIVLITDRARRHKPALRVPCRQCAVHPAVAYFTRWMSLYAPPVRNDSTTSDWPRLRQNQPWLPVNAATSSPLSSGTPRPLT